MKQFNILPSSQDVKNMNDQQWIFCYLNILKDNDEEEELFRMRAKYQALFINPEAVRKVTEEEMKEKNRARTQKEYEQYRKEEVKNNGGFVNDSFEDEMRRALENEEFVALPDEEETRGNSCMSSSEFEQMCLQELENETTNKQPINDLDTVVIDDEDE